MDDNSFFDSIDFDKFLEGFSSSSADESLLSDNFSITSKENEHDDSSSCATSEPYNGESGVMVLKKRKFKPHAMKTDIRRQYATMFTNVVNSMDFKLLFGFLDTFFIKGFKQENIKENQVTKERNDSYLQGIIPSAKFWFTLMTTAPDAIIHTSKTQIHHNSATTRTRITSTFGYTATQIYDVYGGQSKDRFQEMLHKNDIYNSSSSVECDTDTDGATTSGDDSSSVGNGAGRKRKHIGDSVRSSSYSVNDISNLDEVVRAITTEVEQAASKLSLLDVPTVSSALGTLTMYTDENKYISKIVIETPFVATMGKYCPPGAGVCSAR